MQPISIYAIQDIGNRDYQEDRYSVEIDVYDGYDYIAVYDGHGGDKVSDWMSNNHYKIVRELLQKGNSAQESLRASIQLVEKIMPNSIAQNCGTTAIIILKKNNIIWSCNIGDSRAIMNNSEGVIELSYDHKPNRTDELNRIKASGGIVTTDMSGIWRVNGNLSLSRAIGDYVLRPHVISRPELHIFEQKTNNNFILIASDGLWDVLTSDFVINLINNEIKKFDIDDKKLLMRLITLKLLKIARHKMSHDNITILLLFI